MKYALITGASSGIGKQMAYLLARDKYGLIIVARRENLLNKIRDDIVQKYGVDVHVLSVDVSSLPSGTYFYEIFVGKQRVKNGTFIKN